MVNTQPQQDKIHTCHLNHLITKNFNQKNASQALVKAVHPTQRSAQSPDHSLRSRFSWGGNLFFWGGEMARLLGECIENLSFYLKILIPIGWLFGWLVGWLVGRLVGWIGNSLVFSKYPIWVDESYVSTVSLPPETDVNPFFRIDLVQTF